MIFLFLPLIPPEVIHLGNISSRYSCDHLFCNKEYTLSNSWYVVHIVALYNLGAP